MRGEYDFSGGVRGKYVDQYRRGTNVVLLDPEVAEAFPDSKSVNDALRAILAVATRTERRSFLEQSIHIPVGADRLRAGARRGVALVWRPWASVADAGAAGRSGRKRRLDVRGVGPESRGDSVFDGAGAFGVSENG